MPADATAYDRIGALLGGAIATTKAEGAGLERRLVRHRREPRRRRPAHLAPGSPTCGRRWSSSCSGRDPGPESDPILRGTGGRADRHRQPASWSRGRPRPTPGALARLRGTVGGRGRHHRGRDRRRGRSGHRRAGPDPLPDRRRAARSVRRAPTAPYRWGRLEPREGCRSHEARVRHRRRRLLPREGPHGLQPGQPVEGARAPGHHAEAGPVPQRRPRDDEPVPARRGVRHQRRRRDRPGHRSLRALPGHRPRPDRQRDDRPGLLQRDRQGAARGLPRRHRAGDPAHHQRDQGPDPGDGLGRTSTW